MGTEGDRHEKKNQMQFYYIHWVLQDLCFNAWWVSVSFGRRRSLQRSVFTYEWIKTCSSHLLNKWSRIRWRTWFCSLSSLSPRCSQTRCRPALKTLAALEKNRWFSERMKWLMAKERDLSRRCRMTSRADTRSFISRNTGRSEEDVKYTSTINKIRNNLWSVLYFYLSWRQTERWRPPRMWRTLGSGHWSRCHLCSLTNRRNRLNHLEATITIV